MLIQSENDGFYMLSNVSRDEWTEKMWFEFWIAYVV